MNGRLLEIPKIPESGFLNIWSASPRTGHFLFENFVEIYEKYNDGMSHYIFETDLKTISSEKSC